MPATSPKPNLDKGLDIASLIDKFKRQKVRQYADKLKKKLTPEDLNFYD